MVGFRGFVAFWIGFFCIGAVLLAVAGCAVPSASSYTPAVYKIDRFHDDNYGVFRDRAEWLRWAYGGPL